MSSVKKEPSTREISQDVYEGLQRIFGGRSADEIHQWSGLPLDECRTLAGFFSEQMTPADQAGVEAGEAQVDEGGNDREIEWQRQGERRQNERRKQQPKH